MRMRCRSWLVMAGLMVAGAGAWAQAATDAGPERFEAATIKPDATPGQHFSLSMSRSPEFTATQVGAGGPKLRRSAETTEHGIGLPGMIRVTGAPMDTVVRGLARQLMVPVKDKTGLKGLYDAILRFDPKNKGTARQPSIFAAVEEQLGLKLVPAKVSVETMMIVHAGRIPVEN